MSNSRQFIISFILLFVIMAGSTLAEAQDASATNAFSADLAKLIALRKGHDTDLKAVKSVSDSLLQQYTEPGQKGRILYELLVIDAQAGLPDPGDAIGVAKEAALLPLEPIQKVHLYLYWGDAESLLNRTRLEDLRTHAGPAYIAGVSELLKQDLPDALPELPAVPKYDAQPGSPRYQQIVQEHDAAMQKRQLVVSQREMIQLRKQLVDHLADMFARQHPALDKLEDLAKKSIDRQETVKTLVGLVKAADHSAPITGPGN